MLLPLINSVKISLCNCLLTFNINKKIVLLITYSPEKVSNKLFRIRGVYILDSVYIIHIKHDHEYSVQFTRVRFDQKGSPWLNSTVIAWFTVLAWILITIGLHKQSHTWQRAHSDRQKHRQTMYRLVAHITPKLCIDLLNTSNRESTYSNLSCFDIVHLKCI